MYILIGLGSKQLDEIYSNLISGCTYFCRYCGGSAMDPGPQYPKTDKHSSGTEKT